MYNILAIAKNTEILQVLHRLVNQTADWHGQTTDDLNEAEFLLAQEEFDIVLCGTGLSESDEQRLSDFFQQLTYQPKLVRHYGGGSGLLYSEVAGALVA